MKWIVQKQDKFSKVVLLNQEVCVKKWTMPGLWGYKKITLLDLNVHQPFLV
jgi:hypothetical protein